MGITTRQCSNDMKQHIDFQITRADGRTRLDFDNQHLEVTAQKRKNKDGEMVETGVTVYKLKYGEALSKVLEGAGLVTAREDGSAEVVHKVNLTIEARDGKATEAARAAKGTEAFLKLLRRRCGLSTSKQKVADGDKVSLEDLRDWVAGKKQLAKRDFASLEDKAQREVEKMAAKLEGKPVGGAKPKPIAIVRAQLERGDFANDPEQLAAVTECLKEHAERVARLAKGRAAKAA